MNLQHVLSLRHLLRADLQNVPRWEHGMQACTPRVPRQWQPAITIHFASHGSNCFDSRLAKPKMQVWVSKATWGAAGALLLEVQTALGSTNLSGWTSGSDPCTSTWQGVQCSGGRVTNL